MSVFITNFNFKAIHSLTCNIWNIFVRTSWSVHADGSSVGKMAVADVDCGDSRSPVNLM